MGIVEPQEKRLEWAATRILLLKCRLKLAGLCVFVHLKISRKLHEILRKLERIQLFPFKIGYADQSVVTWECPAIITYTKWLPPITFGATSDKLMMVKHKA